MLFLQWKGDDGKNVDTPEGATALRSSPPKSVLKRQSDSEQDKLYKVTLHGREQPYDI